MKDSNGSQEIVPTIYLSINGELKKLYSVSTPIDFDGTNDYLSRPHDFKQSNDTKYSRKFLVLFKKEPSKKKIKKLCKKYGIVAFSLVDY